MTRRLARLPSELVRSGITPSLENDVPPLWVDGGNVVFRDGGIRPEPGQFKLFDKLQKKPVIGVNEMVRDGNKILYWGSVDKLYKGDRTQTPPTAEVGTGYTGIQDATESQEATRWSLEPWGRWMFAANGINDLQVDKATGTMVPLEDEVGFTFPDGIADNFAPEIVLKIKSFLMAFRQNDGDAGLNTVYWCSDNSPLDWATAADNSAGNIPIRDMPSPIIAALPMGSGAATYSTSSMHLVQFIGSPNWFGVARVLDGIGAFGKHSVVVVGRRHFGMGPRGIFETDGTDFRYIDQPEAHRYIYDDINLVQKSKVVGWHDVDLERVVWFYCSKQSNTWDRAIGFDYRNRVWMFPQYYRSAASQTAVFDFPITADEDGNIYLQSIGSVPPPPDSAPIQLQDSVGFSGVGFGEGGFGTGGFGGTWNG